MFKTLMTSKKSLIIGAIVILIAFIALANTKKNVETSLQNAANPGNGSVSNKPDATTDSKIEVSKPFNIQVPSPGADQTHPAPTPAPKPQQWGDGTYEVGRDIPVGNYIANGESCYWSITSDSNGKDYVGSNFGNGQQLVALTTPGTFFKVSGCPFTART